MKNKAFTLIELLAVIVILAIIALIATPIILGIINSTREEARKRSAEAVSHAVETAYIQTAMKVEANGSARTFDNEDVIRNTKIENEKSRTETSITTNDGVTCALSSDYVLTCTYGSDTEPLITPRNISNGSSSEETSTQVFNPTTYTFYNWSTFETNLTSNSSLDDISTTTNPQTLGNVYLGIDYDSNNKITDGYVCYVIDNQESCLKADTNSTLYNTNLKILKDSFGESNCNFHEHDPEDEFDLTDYWTCTSGSLKTHLYEDGTFDAYFEEDTSCSVSYIEENYFEFSCSRPI